MQVTQSQEKQQAKPTTYHFVSENCDYLDDARCIACGESPADNEFHFNEVHPGKPYGYVCDDCLRITHRRGLPHRCRSSGTEGDEAQGWGWQVNPDPFRVQTRLSQRRHGIELALLRTVFPVPRFYVHAKAEGIQAGDFWSIDHRLLWASCELAADKGRGAVYWLATEGLRQEGHWTEHKMATMGLWNDAKLADLAFGTMEYDLTPENTRAAARRLIRFSVRQCSFTSEKFPEVKGAA